MFTKNFKPSVWLSFKISLLKKSEITIFLMFVTSVFIFSNLILLFDIDTFLDTPDDRAESPFFLVVY